jgi:hypothetical protein
MKFKHFIITSILLFTFALYAQPQQLYKIDLIVFTQVSANGLLSEQWPADPRLPNMKRVYNLQPAPLSSDSSESALRKLYQIFPSSSMKGLLAKLVKNKNYEVVLQTAWLQSGLSNRRARRIHIFGGQAYDASGSPTVATSPLNQINDELLPAPQQAANWQINGFVRMSKPFLFQFNADLVLTIPQAVIAKLSTKAASQLKTNQFILRQMYRMKPNQIYYIDHPLYGVLVEITQYPKSKS